LVARLVAVPALYFSFTTAQATCWVHEDCEEGYVCQCIVYDETQGRCDAAGGQCVVADAKRMERKFILQLANGGPPEMTLPIPSGYFSTRSGSK
jgi:hypothetical protein